MACFKVKQYSIIIPTLNEAAAIQDCLIALQPLRDQCEIIIADGGSVDATYKNSTALVDFFISTTKGRALQMNAGAQQASADILIFLHADTMLPDHALQLIQYISYYHN